MKNKNHIGIKFHLIHFHENFNKLDDGTIYCMLKGYYKLPWEYNVIQSLIKYKDIIDNVHL